MKISFGDGVVEGKLERCGANGAVELALNGGVLAVPPPGDGFAIVSATQDEREALRLAGYVMRDLGAPIGRKPPAAGSLTGSFLHWQDPRAATLPGYADAAAALRRCEAIGQGIRDAYVRVADGRVVAIGGVDVSDDGN